MEDQNQSQRSDSPFEEEAIRWRNAVAEGNLDLADSISKALLDKGVRLGATINGVWWERVDANPAPQRPYREGDTCPNCGGIHFGSGLRCPFKDPPHFSNVPNPKLQGGPEFKRAEFNHFLYGLTATVRLIVESHFDKVSCLAPTLEPTEMYVEPKLEPFGLYTEKLPEDGCDVVEYAPFQLEWGPVLVTPETVRRECARMAERVIHKAHFVGHFPRLVWRTVPAFIEHHDFETKTMRITLSMRGFVKPNPTETPDGSNKQDS